MACTLGRWFGTWASAPVLVLSLACGGCTSADGAGQAGAASPGLRLTFEESAPGALPAGWLPAETRGAGTPGRWSVATGSDTERGRILRLADVQNHGSTFNLLLSERSFAANVELSVLLRADAGTEDQGGGLLWRAAGPDDYYVTRWNPLEGNLRLYKVVGGERTQLGSADVAAEAAAWHALGVQAEGARLRVSFDGRVLLDCADGTLTGPGRVGLWTKADAATSFDDLRIVE